MNVTPRLALLREVVLLALDTLRASKMRSALTVLGVVIGITAIVGMTSLIRGFDQSLRDSIRTLGPNTIFVAKFSGVSLVAGRNFADLARRPNLTVDDAKAIEKLAPSVQTVDIWLGAMGDVQDRVVYEGNRTKLLNIIGATEEYATLSFVKLESGRFFSAPEVDHKRKVVVLGDTPYQALFATGGLDPVNKKVRIGAAEYTVVGVFGKRPSAGVGRDKALSEVEEIMRIRHGLTLDEADDFDVVTQDAALKVWDQVSQATFLGLVVISSIALMVGGIGVMAIMTISVTERTREIGVLTLVGGLLGILLGAGIGVTVHLATGFPISLPWWSFALGLGFSAAVGIFFGMVPAVRAARLDPIEALRYE